MKNINKTKLVAQLHELEKTDKYFQGDWRNGAYPLIDSTGENIIGLIHSDASANFIDGSRNKENLKYKIINDEYAVLV